MKASIPLKMVEKTYNDAINALNSLQSNYANIMAIRESGIRKNDMAILEMKEWSRRIGYSISDLNKLNMVHITGTKGKGSTAAFASSILNQYKRQLPKIGLYTSPHLRNVRERIRINGEPISEDKFTAYFFDVWNRLDNSSSNLDQFPHMTPGSKPGYFKFLTLLSFHTFLQEACNACVYEVGIGGEYDSTNIVEKPLTCGVSLLGIDHTYMLGNTIEEIAWNKAGIFKHDVSAFTVSNQPKEGHKVLVERAREKNTTLIDVPVFNQLKVINLGIAGKFQTQNASLAVALASDALHKLRVKKPMIAADKVDSVIPTEFLEGLASTRWEGRCQTIIRGKNHWYIDGAHTKDSIEAASGWFKDVTSSSDRRKIILFNQQTRDANSLVQHLLSVLTPSIKFTNAIFTTNVTWKSGTYSSDLVSMNTSKEDVDNLKIQEALAMFWVGLDPESSTHVVQNIETAVDLIDNLTSEPLDIFVTGSLHLVGGLLVIFDKICK
ncbi:hypothetical protein KAFR_0A03820 [Kazachstania africana CBS 2517]|uniref:Folylpolyglutamate synthase n=1 Tax=Kazachstania africana (strain ATCC 22294 / BCRC 22015 / CBS 2517 / CECT 1963 / NBRC 1671 / NRRL Y-8276) TaxID=1071382 RepID=H2AN67_KAZAF|nr:hypothetical protein KAFR_0A03820 [Kazachstania africana CBS 2517]CCF55817.1 hypothetical protein KAFR_0A03820 [Kazachstania africana CBS 2517]